MAQDATAGSSIGEAEAGVSRLNHTDRQCVMLCCPLPTNLQLCLLAPQLLQPAAPVRLNVSAGGQLGFIPQRCLHSACLLKHLVQLGAQGRHGLQQGVRGTADQVDRSQCPLHDAADITRPTYRNNRQLNPGAPLPNHPAPRQPPTWYLRMRTILTYPGRAATCSSTSGVPMSRTAASAAILTRRL
jgi:hypothetical protein